MTPSVVLLKELNDEDLQFALFAPFDVFRGFFFDRSLELFFGHGDGDEGVVGSILAFQIEPFGPLDQHLHVSGTPHLGDDSRQIFWH